MEQHKILLRDSILQMQALLLQEHTCSKDQNPMQARSHIATLKYPLEWGPRDMNKKKKDLNKDWTKAKEIIPGGNSFFQKDQSNFLVGAGQLTTKLKAVKSSHLMILNI